MAIDKEKIIQTLQEMANNAQLPQCPSVLLDERLEDAFKISEVDEQGYSEEIPVLWRDYGYGKMENGILVIMKRSSKITSTLYTKYLDEKALVWDQVKERLLLYMPDGDDPRMGFKGSTWIFAKKLKPEYEGICDLEDIYLDYLNQNKEK